MEVEVDQSWKIEDTRSATVLAFSDGISHAILIPAKVKKECIRRLRARGKSGPTLTVYLFATALFLLLRDYMAEIDCAVIDVEYESHDREIKQHLLNLFRRAGHDILSEQIAFRRIGKKSPGHKRAVEVFRGKVQPDRYITLEDLLEQM